MFRVGKNRACLWTEESNPHARARLMAIESFLWFLLLQPVISRGNICPVELKNRDNNSGIIYTSKGSIPAFSNGSLDVPDARADLLSLFWMSNLSLEKSNGS